ncbi:MAG: hypothetical protein AAGI69_04600 [Cyanobacteria bacterium P01_H01_bin.21]
MAPSKDQKESLLARLRHLDRRVRALVMAVIVVMAVGLVIDLPQLSPSQTLAAEQYQVNTGTPLPLSMPVGAGLRHSRMTGASMTSHNLTAAYFVGRPSADKLSAETQQTTKRG